MLTVGLVLLLIALVLTIFAMLRNNHSYLCIAVLLVIIDLLLGSGAGLLRIS